jgi:membrane-anchored protein YejM (alkaline phosphatase superfamily)
MQSEAPELQDISGESAATRKLYGIDDPITEDFGRQCLMARRLSERGVRFVQASHTYKWDQHSRLRRDHEQNAHEVDKPIAALLHDLKSRGLLKDTLVIWGGEFGRTPTAQGSDGRDHNQEAFTYWLAGGGVKPGLQYGATDDYGYYSVENKVHFHDLHATVLHLLGLDHKRLTYRYAGRDFRLTDVHGNVVHDIMA